MKPTFRPVLCLASICLLPIAAQAQLLGPFTVRVGTSLEHDSNVLRAPSDQERADTIGTLSLGLKGDKQYGLQRFRVNVEATKYRYQHLSELDYSTVNYSAAWDFQITPRLQGVLSADRTQYRDVGRFVDLKGIEQAGGTGGRTDRTELLEARYLVDGPWRVLGGVVHTSTSMRDARRDFQNPWDASPTVRSVRVGVAYEYASGTEFTARVRRGNGDYRDPQAVSGGSVNFRENEAELMAKWPVTAKTRVDGRVAYLERLHSANSALNFSGPVGDAVVTYDITPKTSLVGGVASELYSYQLGAPGYIRSNRFYVKPIYKPTVQTQLSVRYVRETRSRHGAPLATVDNGQEDVSQWLLGTVNWNPRRNIDVSGTVGVERRNSSFAAAGYRNTTVGAAAAYSF